MSTLTQLSDGDGLSLLESVSTDGATYLNNIPQEGLRRGTFNRYHARSLISTSTVFQPFDRTGSGVVGVGGTYAYQAGVWDSLYFQSFDTDGSSATNDGTEQVEGWTVVGHTLAGAGGNPCEVSFSESNLGEYSDEGYDGGIWAQGTLDIRFANTGGTDVTFWTCIQFRVGENWYTIENSARAWNIPSFQGAHNVAFQTDLECSSSTLLTRSIVEAESGDADGLVNGMRFCMAFAETLAPPTGVNFILGHYSFMAVGLFAEIDDEGA